MEIHLKNFRNSSKKKGGIQIFPIKMESMAFTSE